MTHNKLKTPKFLKHNIYYTGAVAEGQQTSDKFHRPVLHSHKKPLRQWRIHKQSQIE
jgi:hypothetical protein